MRTLVASLLLCLCGHARSQSEPRVIDESTNYATPIMIVQPYAPRDATDDAFPVKLRLKGRVTGKGAFELTAVEPAQGVASFVNALNIVLEHWRFLPKLGADCQPTDADAIVDVWFEIKDGKRTVSVSVPAPPERPSESKPRIRRAYVDKPRKPEYPVDARKRDMDGFAEVIMQVNADGKVLTRGVLQSIPLESFGKAAMYATTFVSFNKREDGDGNICIGVPLSFCLDSPASIPMAACEKQRRARAQ